MDYTMILIKKRLYSKGTKRNIIKFVQDFGVEGIEKAKLLSGYAKLFQNMLKM